MTKFALIALEQVVGQIKFFELSADGKCPFTEFCNTIEGEGNYTVYLDNIWSIMNWMSEGKTLAEGMVKPIKGGSNNEFEIRKGPLRVYFIKEPEGHIVITGGKKTNQKKDIPRFQRINKKYSESK